MKHKDNIYEEEQPAFLDVLSDAFDIRNWKLLAFNAATTENENNQAAESEIEIMIEKFP